MLFTVVCTLFCVATGVVASQVPLLQQVDGGKWAITPDLSSYAESLVHRFGIHGLSVGVVRLAEGGSIETEFGVWGNMSEDGEVTKPETLFAIGSCSKAFLVSAMGILMDDFAHGHNTTALPPGVETFTWDTKIHALLPGDEGWKLADAWASEKANVRDVLTHVSGLPRHDFSYSWQDAPVDVVKRLRYLKPAFELRERWYYNNQMFVLGAHIVSTYAGVSFPEFVRTRIFERLNMNASTYYGFEAESLSQSWSADGRRIPYWLGGPAAEVVAGAGGIVSSTVDMTKWLAVLLNEGVNPRTNLTVITKVAFDEATTAHSVVTGKPSSTLMSLSGYGMGWARISFQGRDMVVHTGGLPGFQTFVAFMPSDSLGIVSVVNTDDPNAVHAAVPYRIIQDILGLPRISADTVAQSSNLATHVAPISQQHNSLAVQHFAPIPVPLETFAGNYTDAGYGTFTLCVPTSTSSYCERVLADYAAVRNLSSDLSTLYAEWPRAWSSHLRMSHISDLTFRLSLESLFVEGYGRDTSPFVYSMTGEAYVEMQCAMEGPRVLGCGIMQGLDAFRRREGGTVRERADVWFAKV